MPTQLPCSHVKRSPGAKGVVEEEQGNGLAFESITMWRGLQSSSFIDKPLELWSRPVVGIEEMPDRCNCRSVRADDQIASNLYSLVDDQDSVVGQQTGLPGGIRCPKTGPPPRLRATRVGRSPQP